MQTSEKTKKRITYEDELDGISSYEPESPSKEEQDENEIEVKKEKPQPI